MTVAKCLWHNFIGYYGILEHIHTDQGTDFKSKLIEELCKIAGIQRVQSHHIIPEATLYSNLTGRF